MAVTLSQIRTQIADRPQIYPPYNTDPELIGVADGVATIFSLQFENYIPGTLTVYTAPAPSAGAQTTFTAISASQYVVGSPGGGVNATNATNAIITFVAAPAAGTLVAARYQATAFSDADLQVYLAQNQAKYSDDQSIKKGCQFDLIDAILMDQRRLEMLAQGDDRKDRSAYINGLLKIKEALRKDLSGDPTPGKSTPALIIGSSPAGRYQPLR